MKTKYFFTSLYVCISLNAKAQNYHIIDSITKNTIPFASILIIGTQKGFYCDEIGVFSLSVVEESDSIQISHINYNTKKIKRDNLNDTIFLTPKTQILKEIIIQTRKAKAKTIGYIKNKKKLSWFIQPKTELSTLIKYSKSFKFAQIKKIHIPIGKKIILNIEGKFEKKYSEFNSVFRVHLYSNKKNEPNQKLLSRPIVIKCNKYSKEILEIDISDQLIEYPEEGVFVGVEMIGEVDENGKIINNVKPKAILPSFKFTRKKKKNISSVSFIKTIFSDNKWEKIDEYHKEANHLSKYNMAVSLVLKIYN